MAASARSGDGGCLRGDLPEQAQLKLIDKFSGKNLLFKETLTRKLSLLHAGQGTLTVDLRVGAGPGRWRWAEEGKKGSPFRYWRDGRTA